MNIQDMLEQMSNQGNQENHPKLTYGEEVAALRESLAAHNTKHHFEPGMLVRQKPAARVYQDLSPNQVGIVVEVLAEPIVDTSRPSGSPHYRERMDMIVGERAPNGDFLLMHVDSRRFEPIAN